MALGTSSESIGQASQGELRHHWLFRIGIFGGFEEVRYRGYAAFCMWKVEAAAKGDVKLHIDGMRLSRRPDRSFQP